MNLGWKNVALQEVAEIERDIIEPSAISDGTTYVGLENIETGGLFVNVRNVTGGELASTKFAFTDKHVLYGKLRPYLAKIARPTFNGVCSTDILPILPKANLDRDYLTYFLRQPSMVELATSRSTGANLPRLSPKVLAEFSIPLPPIAQQKRIAAILDKADELKSLRRRALEQLDAIAQSIFLEMFGDPAKNPKNWEVHELQKVVRQGTIVTYGIVQAGEEFPDGVPYIRTGDIVNGEIRIPELRRTAPEIASKFERSKVDAGDIVMSIRATVGTTALVPTSLEGANLTQGTARIAPSDKTERLYLLHYLRLQSTQQWIARQVKGATFREITLARLRELPVLLPPLNLQREFARRIEAIERLKTTHRESLAQLDALFASLQHRAFRGEL